MVLDGILLEVQGEASPALLGPYALAALLPSTFRFCRHYAVLCELLVGLAPCPQTHPTIEEKKAADSVPQGISQPDHSSLVFSKYHEPMRLSASAFSLYQTISNPQSFNLPVLWHCVLVDL